MRPRRRELIHAITVSSQLSTCHHKGSHKLQESPCATAPLLYTLVSPRHLGTSLQEPSEANRHMRYSSHSSSSAEGTIHPSFPSRVQLHQPACVWTLGECKHLLRIVSHNCHQLVWRSVLLIFVGGDDIPSLSPMLSVGSESFPYGCLRK
jgi:hypothetical protein